jgi:hypothetical protein
MDEEYLHPTLATVSPYIISSRAASDHALCTWLEILLSVTSPPVTRCKLDKKCMAYECRLLYEISTLLYSSTQYDTSKSSNVVMFRVSKHVHLQQYLLHHDLTRKRNAKSRRLPSSCHINYENLQWQCRSALCIKNIKSADQPQPCLRRIIFLRMGNHASARIWPCLVLQKDVKLFLAKSALHTSPPNWTMSIFTNLDWIDIHVHNPPAFWNPCDLY